MSSKVKFLTIDNDGLILVALVSSTIAILDDEPVPVRKELILRLVSSENIVIIIRVCPFSWGSQVTLWSVQAASEDLIAVVATAPTTTFEVHHSLLWVSIESISWGEIDSSPWPIKASSVSCCIIVKVQLEWSICVDTCIKYFIRGYQVVADSTEVLSNNNLGVTCLTPANTPRVLCNPEVNWARRSLIGTPTNNKKVVRK